VSLPLAKEGQKRTEIRKYWAIPDVERCRFVVRKRREETRGARMGNLVDAPSTSREMHAAFVPKGQTDRQRCPIGEGGNEGGTSTQFEEGPGQLSPKGALHKSQAFSGLLFCRSKRQESGGTHFSTDGNLGTSQGKGGKWRHNTRP